MKYIRRPIEVEAMQMPQAFSVGEAQGDAGEWVVLAGQEIFIFADEEFQAEFMPVVAIPEMKQSKHGSGIPKQTRADITPVSDEEFERTEKQTNILVCMTCGEDVPAHKVNKNKDCPKCAEVNFIPEPDIIPIPAVKGRQRSKLEMLLLDRINQKEGIDAAV